MNNFCKKCGAELTYVKTCSACKTAVKQPIEKLNEEKICSKCGQIMATSKLCPNCKVLSPNTDVDNEKETNENCTDTVQDNSSNKKTYKKIITLCIAVLIVIMFFCILPKGNDTSYNEDDVFANYVNDFGWDEHEGSFNIDLDDFDNRVTTMAADFGWKEIEKNTGFLHSRTVDNRYTYKFRTSDGAMIAFGVIRRDGKTVELRFQKDSDIMGDEERKDIKKKMLLMLIGNDVKNYNEEIKTTPTCRVEESVDEISFEPYQEISYDDLVVNNLISYQGKKLNGFKGFSSKLLSYDSTGKFNVIIEAYGNYGTSHIIGWFNSDFSAAESTDAYRYPSFEIMSETEVKKAAESKEWRDAFGWE